MIFTCPYAKTMAFGGLETGSKKENDTLRVAGISM